MRYIKQWLLNWATKEFSKQGREVVKFETAGKTTYIRGMRTGQLWRIGK